MSSTKRLLSICIQFWVKIIFFAAVLACFEDQICLTTRNRLGYYETRSSYLKMLRKQQNLCLGVCSHNQTVKYICCGRQDVPAERRISEEQCLRNHRNNGGNILITNGMVARRNEFPFMAAIGWRALFGRNTISYGCGGALISSRHVLTAAHCLYHSNEKPIVVRPGGYDLDDKEAKDIDIERIYEHPGYNHPDSYNDIAIILLKEPYNPDNVENAEPACVWAQPLYRANVTAIGYGNTKFAGLSSPNLMKAELKTIPNQECAKYYEQDNIIYSQLCANDPVRKGDTCQGDSGGPIIMYRDIGNFYHTLPYVVGITSYGIGCGTGTPGVYTRVASYIDWIEKIIF
ncbi:serine protease snake-like [Ceratitis capitata]|uniref:serine protease snake-like n=1 Tax=Ceratitis capitata TaxID=7213 RepID=UPI000A120FCE|nr:serine protease snake-like [Ceratitis capitata]